MGDTKDTKKVVGLKQPIRLTADGRDIFFEKTQEHRHDDLHQEVRDSTKED